jgi:hypothetical protein
MTISSLYLHSSRSSPPIRIGVLVDGMTLPRVFREILVDIESSDFARIESVVINKGSRLPEVPRNRLTRYAQLLVDPARRTHLLLAAYEKVDQRYCLQNDPTEMVDCTDLLSSKPQIKVAPITKRFVHRFPPEALDRIRSYKLDVLLRFGFNILRGDILNSAKYGVWSFHHGDNQFYRGGPELLWEVIEDNPLSGVILQVLTEKLDDGLVLCKALFATERGLWRSRNLNGPYWGSRHFMIRKLHQLHERGWDSVRQEALAPCPYQGRQQIYRAPANSDMLRWLAPKLGRKVLERLDPFRVQTLSHWRVALSRADSPKLLTENVSQWSSHRWVPCPVGHFYADPMLVRWKSQHWLFCEDYMYDEGRGRISCAPVGMDLTLGEVAPCLDLPYHLSYPHVFFADGEWYMIPESSANGSVELWRSARFPYEWKLEKTLFHGALVDTTPVYKDGTWYFFTTFLEPPTSAVFAALFFAESITAEWKLHPASPISLDVRTARSAGPIQLVDGRLFRPVQDCSESYGRRIRVREIVRLTRDDFAERPMHTIEPVWEPNLDGVHTYGYCEGIEVLDAVAQLPATRVLGHRPDRRLPTSAS